MELLKEMTCLLDTKMKEMTCLKDMSSLVPSTEPILGSKKRKSEVK